MFDFENTVEIGGEFGLTYFAGKEILNAPCPTHEMQRVIYPFKTDMKVDPGQNYHFAVTMNAYDFIEGVNFYCTYTYLHHTQDDYTLRTANSNFKPELLNRGSGWKSQTINAALNASPLPGLNFGLVWQAAFSQENARAPHTILGTVTFLF